MATTVTGPAQRESVGARADVPAATLRTDRWWLPPLVTVLALLAFIVYSTWAAFQNDNYFADPYISPFYSPCIAANCVEGAGEVAIIGEWWKLSPALLILVVPLGFRVTCYYYRKAGYRSFFLAPAACAVPEPHKKYTGESRFPFVLQNLHRYFFYAAVLFGLINVYDAILAFHGKDGFGIGLGTVIIWINLAMLWAYTLSCHACRHIVGGRLKHFSKHPLRYRYWTFVSKLNARHGQFAMISLFTVIITDAYIMAVSAGWISDFRFVG